jgi:hypothetical protein
MVTPEADNGYGTATAPGPQTMRPTRVGRSRITSKTPAASSSEATHPAVSPFEVCVQGGRTSMLRWPPITALPP